MLTSSSTADKLIDNKPMEASVLPVSDKPVTLSFKGALGQKTALAAPAASAVAKKAAPVALGFSLNDDEGSEEGDEAGEKNDASAGDKGLSHALGCEKVHLWTCALTSRSVQLLLRRNQLHRWSPARRYVFAALSYPIVSV